MLLAVVACEVPAHQTPAVAPKRDWDLVTDQARAMAKWRELDPTGATWGEVIDRIPKSARMAMAFALVRDGRFECTRRSTWCGMESADAARDDERIDAPCLRHELVHHLVANAGRIAIPADVLAALTRVKDDELLSLVAGSLEDRALVDWLVALEATGTPAPSYSLQGRPADIVAMAARRHVDAAISELSRETDRALLIAAISDRELAPDVREDAIRMLDLEFSEPQLNIEQAEPALVAALEAAAVHRDCALAATASEALATLGELKFLPRRPTDPKAFFHRACVLTAGDFYDHSTTLAATYVPKQGLLLVGPQGEEYADSKTPTRRHVSADDGELIPFLRTLVGAKCDANTCTTDTARYELGWRAGLLARVTVHRNFAGEEAARAAADECDPGLEGSD